MATATRKANVTVIEDFLTEQNVGTKNGATVSVKEYGNGYQHTSVFTSTNTPVTVGNVTGISFGGLKIYDFPLGRFKIIGGRMFPFSLSWAGQDIAAAGSGDISLGTTITADGTLATTEVDIMASTALLDPFVSGVGGIGAAGLGGTLVNDTFFDGTVIAKDLNVNLIIDDADVADGASDIVLLTGVLVVRWDFLGV